MLLDTYIPKKWADYTKKSPADSMCCVNKMVLSLFLKFSTATLHFSHSESAFTFLKESGHWNFPGGPLVKNLPAHAGDMGLMPRLGRLHVPQGNQAMHCSYWAHAPGARAFQQEKPPQWEAHAPQLQSSPRLWQLVKAHMQRQRPSTAKNNVKKNFLMGYGLGKGNLSQ